MDKRRVCWVAWNKIVKPKECGGLGIDSLIVKNNSLCFKWYWRYLQEHVSDWKHLIKRKYDTGANWMEPVFSMNHMSNVWKNILLCSNDSRPPSVSLKDNLQIRVGCGTKESLWHDNWSGVGALKSRFPRLFSIYNDQGVSLAYVVPKALLLYSNDSWRRTLYEWEEADFKYKSHLVEGGVVAMAETSFVFHWVVFVVLSLVLHNFSAPESALITQIPGFNGTFPSKHYSGYVTIDESHGRRLFYYFVESEGNPSKDPVVLWLNGGPGCSSFDGLIYENGPFNFEAAKTRGDLPKLHLNPYSWSKVSSVLYLDSPAGVGLSYSNNKTDYITGDLKTASDSHTFLLKWFELYPEFLPNPFFLSGESYAGIYVPTLAYEVVKGIDAGIKPVINLKGYMIGNGCTDNEFDGNAHVPFAHGMGLISNDQFEEVTKACNGKFYEPRTDTCQSKIDQVYQVLIDLNIYDVLEPCYHAPNIREVTDADSRLPSSFRKLGETDKPLPVRKRMFGRAWPFRAPVIDGILPTWPQLLKDNGLACTSDEVATTWVNNEAIRKALHAENISVSGPWMLCTDRITFTSDAGSMIKYHRNLTLRGFRALIFSGDHDLCVPFTGSQRWTRSMGYEIVDEWRPWTSNGQVAGYTQGYANNLTFLTIKGSGHTVPEYKPREALDFYSRFLAGKPI
ncbi:Serine carboxypeptidase-like 20 [Turnera subulata]|uniref:Carboxypeptidase n=1 Tax=Turnera subulata TaxID=218843 RepID=A0A9Q0FMU3_9ROSI|nr:Serine carboxypeptidase-like 20 [Turnera subulata]